MEIAMIEEKNQSCLLLSYQTPTGKSLTFDSICFRNSETANEENPPMLSVSIC